MKKITLFLAAALTSGFVFGQSQRLMLVEEFTQASCGPCASQNPALNTLLAANTSKVVSVKYQTSWPGTDPMNAQNPTEVANRVTYYSVTGVPFCNPDGAAGGAPSTITQTSINTEYAVASPFNIVLNHWFNTANDSIYINCEVTCTQATNMTTPRLRIAMVEKTITFSTAPGSNGEKLFYNVMRKMYPNANGTGIATAWTVGQKKTVSFKAKIPTYVYSKPQIGVVAWIQDDGNKNVKQSAFSQTPSAPLALPPVADFLGDVTASCDGIVNFQDQSALFPTSWAWYFGDGTASTVKNPVHKYSASGTYAVSLTSTNANGSSAPVTKTGYVTVTLSGTAPTGVSDNICGFGVANLSATASGSGTLNWYDYNGAMVHTGTTYAPNVTGTTDFWVAEMTPNAVKSEGEPDNTMGAGATFTATVTHGLYFDVLKPCTLKSVVCYASAAGVHAIQVMDAAGNIIQTASPNIPSGMSTVNLNFNLPAGTGYILQTPNSMNLFRNTAGALYPYNTSGVISITGATAANGYYYFFYDWKVQQNPCATPSVKVSGIDTCTSTGVNNLTVTNSLLVFPNPSNGSFTTSFNTTTADNYSVKISNTLGQVVYEEKLNNFSGNYSREINIATYGKGIYMLSIFNSKNEDVKKIITF